MLTISSNFSETPIKYFIPQTIGSLLILLGSGFLSSGVNGYMIMLGALLKLAIFPFHQWFSNILAFLGWGLCFFISVWQKIAPLFVTAMIQMSSSSFSLIMLIVVSLSSLMSAMLGVIQTQMRPLMAYSSISHSGWILTSLILSWSCSMLYFLIYAMSLGLLFNQFSKTNIFNLKSKMSLSSGLLILSLAGLPPLIGFIPKALVLMELMNHSVLIMGLLIVSSLISMIFYMKMSSPIFMTTNKKSMDLGWLMLFMISPTLVMLTF